MVKIEESRSGACAAMARGETNTEAAVEYEAVALVVVAVSGGGGGAAAAAARIWALKLKFEAYAQLKSSEEEDGDSNRCLRVCRRHVRREEAWRAHGRAEIGCCAQRALVDLVSNFFVEGEGARAGSASRRDGKRHGVCHLI